MNQQELIKTLYELLSLPNETEWAEFKEAKKSYSFEKLGKYFSAICNEANLRNKEYGWIVFGVNKFHEIIGTDYRNNRKDLDSLKHEIAKHTTSNLTFIEINEVSISDGRVIMFQIPPAPKGIPIAWKRLYYGRDGESLVGLNISKIEMIRNQARPDWSAGICEDAGIKDLDSPAIKKARDEYVIKFPAKEKDVEGWDDVKFLNKVGLAKRGKITRAAILLLGKEESLSIITPAVAQISWFLRNGKNESLDYEHFGPPFILNVDRLFKRVRNLKVRHLPDGTLFPMETTQYDPWVLREALHNCIAHQDYEKGGRINVVEHPSKIIFKNMGGFIPGSLETVIRQDAPQETYRNPFLARAMVNLNMIDTQGSGIKKMFLTQMDRYFPMPDYDLFDPERVKVSINGEIIDERYTKLLIKSKPDLDLWDVIILDKVQRDVKISKKHHQALKKRGLVEGRYPKLFVSAEVAAATDEKARYTRMKGLNNKYYRDLILKHIENHGSASRKEIDELLLDKLPEIYSDKQKSMKIHNLMKALRRDQKIINHGSRKEPKWLLVKNV